MKKSFFAKKLSVFTFFVFPFDYNFSDRPNNFVSQFAVLYSGEECLGSAVIANPGPSLHSLGQEVSAPIEMTETLSQSVKCN